MKQIGVYLGTTDAATAAVAIGSLALIVFIPKLFPRIPGSIVALIAGTIAATALHLPVETIGTKFGGITSGLPALQIPAFRPDLILPLLPSALTVAILAALESLLSAVVADSMSGDRHNSNAELVAQGFANIVSPLVGGIPVTGAIARTATNVRSGAKSPVSGIIHALTLLAVIVAFAPLAKFIPMATLAAVLVVVAYNMGEWREIGSIFRLGAADRSVWMITFVLTVVADLTVAVEVGMALAALLYIYRVAQTTTVGVLTHEDVEDGRPHMLQDKQVPPYVTILRIHGPFLFGATEKLGDETADLKKYAQIVILRLRHMTAVDATGLHALEVLNDRLKKSGKTLLLCGARHQPAKMLKRADFVEHIGKENILPHAQAALQRANEIQAGFAGLGAEFAHDLAKRNL
jgi:SulP family sulfate permease